MKKFSLSVVVLAAAFATVGIARADETSDDQVKAASAKVKDPKLKDHLLRNIDIFGKNDLPAIYILMPGASAEEDIQGSLLTRDFSRDPFFMQNIDREEFELKMSLREFSDEDQDKDKKETKEAARR